jgi:hypothetical protein
MYKTVSKNLEAYKHMNKYINPEPRPFRATQTQYHSRVR